jgi:lysine-arginine-ornithine-binding protein
MKKLLLLGALALLALPAFAQPPTVVRFGVESGYAPFEIKLPDGKLAGFDIDLGEALCVQMGVKCEWVENPFDSMIPALLAKKFDGILSAFSVNEQRKKQVAFSDKLYHTPGALVVQAGSGLKATAESLHGKSIGVQQGTTYETFGRKYWAPKGVTIVTYQTADLARADLVAGRLDGVADNAAVLQDNFLSRPEGKAYAFTSPYITDPEIFGHGTAIGLRKEDTDLLQRLNKAIAEIRKNGTYERLARKYFTFDPYGSD